MPASAASAADSLGQSTYWSPNPRAPSATASTPPTRPQPSVERELADGRMPVELCNAAADSDAARTASAIGRVVALPFLSEAVRSEIDGDAAARGNFSSADVMPLLTRCRASLQARFVQADDDERRRTGLDVRLDLDSARLETDESMGDQRVQARFDATWRTVRKLSELAYDEHIFEVLAGAAACAAIHVAAQPLVEPQTRSIEDLRIEVPPVVDDDRKTVHRARAQRQRLQARRRLPSVYASIAARDVPASAAPSSNSRASSRPSSS